MSGKVGLGRETFRTWLWSQGAGWADIVFLPFTLLMPVYGMIVRLRIWLYKVGIFPTRRVGCRVVSVGNLTVGGTGKTPVTIALARAYQERGYAVGIVSHGYGARLQGAVHLVSDGKKRFMSAVTAGDEAALMSEQLPGIPIVVSRDRYQGCLWLLVHFKVTLILLDDAFQHLGLHRDLNLLLIDATRPMGNHLLLPRGPLRESVSAVHRADAILLTRCKSESDLSRLLPDLTPYRRPVLRCRFAPTAIVQVQSGEVRSPGDLLHQPILAFCGIGNPESFEASLLGLGAKIEEWVCFPDHWAYHRADLSCLGVRAAALKVSFVITTEKDAVKIRTLLPEGMEVWALRIAVEFLDEASLLFEETIQHG